MLRALFALVLAILAVLPASGSSGSAADTTGGAALAVSPSGHYFLQGGRAKLLSGDSGTQVVMQNLNVDYAAWVDAAATEGHSTLHVWAFIAPRQQLDGSQVEGRYGYVYPGITPWQRKPSGPPAFDGGNQWDLLTFDEGTDPDLNYWPRLRDLAQRTQTQGIALGITVFFGWPKDANDFNYHPFNTLNGGPAVTRQDITQIEQPGVEVHTEPWDELWPIRKKTQWLWEQLSLKLINEMQAFDHIWFDFRDEWSYDNDTNMETHFRDFFQSRGALWSDRTLEADFRVTNPSVPPFGSTPAMKTEGGPYSHDGVRIEAWDRATDGVHYLLHNDSREPGIMSWDPVRAEIFGTDPNDDLGRKWTGYAARFFSELPADLDAMVPSDPLVESPAECLASPGAEYAIYIPDGEISVTVDLIDLVEPARGRFYDPRTGTVAPLFAITPGGVQTFLTPNSTQDWALLIQREDLIDLTIFADGFESGDTSSWSSTGN